MGGNWPVKEKGQIFYQEKKDLFVCQGKRVQCCIMGKGSTDLSKERAQCFIVGKGLLVCQRERA